MKISFGSPAEHRPWVDRIAGHIRDPIVRLRFLKTIAPADAASGRTLRVRPWMLAVLGVAIGLGIILLVTVSRAWPRMPSRTHKAAMAIPTPSAAGTANRAPQPDVWLVDQKGERETYSNGLQVDTHFSAATHHRRYLAFPARGGTPVTRGEPAGIIFHTTESPQAPFQASANGTLKRIGESLLEYVRRKQAYNYVIDRFGRVYRVVPESDAANHSGYSAWADQSWSYINLNESFLAVAFEAESPRPARETRINPAQVRSAAVLVEWLRARYHIAAPNCVVHAQVSVNPIAMLVGVHVDWADGFPFEEVGLPDNYVQPLPAVWAYGFDCDANFTGKAGARMRAGIDAARMILASNAADNGLSPDQYRKRLRQRYRALKRTVQHTRIERDESE